VAALGDAKLRGFVYNLLRSMLTLPALVLPILLMFISALSWKNRGAVLFASVEALAFLLIGLAIAVHGSLSAWLVPMEDWTIYGAAISLPIQGLRPILRPIGPRILFTGATIAGVLCLIAFALSRRTSSPTHPSTQADRPSWHQLGILLAPFTLGYLALLLPRAIYVVVLDRYLLALTMVAVLALLRFYQDQVQARLHWASLILLAIFTAYSISATHDTFSMFRGRLAALNELHSGGIAATAINAGFDTNILTQIDQTGFLNDPRILVPEGAYIPPPPFPPLGNCHPLMAELLPSIHPRYALSFDPAACAGQSRFAPVTYREWLKPHSVTIYIVNVVGSP
jgi:hypothetical protein